MEKVKKRWTETKSIERVDRVWLCDVCGLEMNARPSDGYDVPGEGFKEREVHISWEEKESYPEATFGERWYFDVCKECMEQKVFPLIAREFDISPHYHEISW